MKTMRQAYEEYRTLFASMIESGSTEEALMRGAYSAGVIFGLDIARLGPQEAMDALGRMREQLDDFWRMEEPQDSDSIKGP